MFFINELNVWEVSLIENDAHYRLSCSHWAVDLSVNLIYAYRISLSDKGVKNILTKLLPLDDDSLANGVNLRVKGSQGVYSIGLLSYPWSYRARIKAIETGPTDHGNLRSSGDQHLYFSWLKSLEYLSLEKRRLRETSNHEDEVNLLFFRLDLRYKLINFAFDVLK